MAALRRSLGVLARSGRESCRGIRGSSVMAGRLPRSSLARRNGDGDVEDDVLSFIERLERGEAEKVQRSEAPTAALAPTKFVDMSGILQLRNGEVCIRGRLPTAASAAGGAGFERASAKLLVEIPITGFGLQKVQMMRFRAGDNVIVTGKLRSYTRNIDRELAEHGTVTVNEMRYATGYALHDEGLLNVLSAGDAMFLGKSRLMCYTYYVEQKMTIDDIVAEKLVNLKPLTILSNLIDCGKFGLPMDWARLLDDAYIDRPGCISLEDLRAATQSTSRAKDAINALPADKLMQQSEIVGNQARLGYLQVSLTRAFFEVHGWDTKVKPSSDNGMNAEEAQL